MGCRQCDMITTPKRRPIVFDRKEQYGRYTSQSYLNHSLPHCCVLLLLVKLQTTLERFSTRLDDLIVELRKGYYTATVQP